MIGGVIWGKPELIRASIVRGMLASVNSVKNSVNSENCDSSSGHVMTPAKNREIKVKGRA